jgi:hypothetical protein
MTRATRQKHEETEAMSDHGAGSEIELLKTQLARAPSAIQAEKWRADAAEEREATLKAILKDRKQIVRHHSEWHEDDGPVLWFSDVKSWEDVECLEGVYFGTPLCSNAPAAEMHWWIPFLDFEHVINAAQKGKDA